MTNQLVLGTAAFGMNYGIVNKRGEVSSAEIRSILKECWQNGIKEIDTAEAYGEAESKLGESGVNRFSITTKITLGPKDGSGSIINKATHCLNRLRLRKVSNLLLHNEERLNQSDAKSISLKMAKLIEDGYADRVGVSSYEPGRALWLCRKYRFNVVQLPANVWDDRLFKARLLEQFFEMGVLVQVRSLLLQGILVADPQKKEVPQFLKKRLKAFQAKCSRQGLSPLEAAIGHIAKKSERLRVVVGICKKKELKSLLLAFAKKRSLKLQSKTKNLSWFDLRNWKFTEEI